MTSCELANSSLRICTMRAETSDKFLRRAAPNSRDEKLVCKSYLHLTLWHSIYFAPFRRKRRAMCIWCNVHVRHITVHEVHIIYRAETVPYMYPRGIQGRIHNSDSMVWDF